MTTPETPAPGAEPTPIRWGLDDALDWQAAVEQQDRQILAAAPETSDDWDDATWAAWARTADRAHARRDAAMAAAVREECQSFTNSEVAPGLCELCHEPEDQHTPAREPAAGVVQPKPGTDLREQWSAAWPDPFGSLSADQAESVRVMKVKLRAVADEEQQAQRLRIERLQHSLESAGHAYETFTADNARLRAELAESAADVTRLQRKWADTVDRLVKAYAEPDRLRAELAQARSAALTEAADAVQGGRVPVDPATVAEVSRNAMPMALVAYVQLAIAEHFRRLADETQPTTTGGEQAEPASVSPTAVLLASPCDTCRHTLNRHQNYAGCTVPLCVCSRFHSAPEEPTQ